MTIIDLATHSHLRQRVRFGDPALALTTAQLRRRAQSLLQTHIPAVTDKQLTPHSPSQDLHDYVSIATYFWPNPAAPNGLPYTSRDGHLSPDFELYDRPRLDRAVEGMVISARAGWYLDDARFAANAAVRIRRWFLDPPTRMNPHLCFSQMVPGLRTGSFAGIIDFSLYLPIVLDHVQLLSQLESTPWTPDDQQALAAWCRTFLAWLDTHPFGAAEQALPNNHGTFYDRLVASLALFLGQRDRAVAQLAKTAARIPQQIEPDGTMPHELKRTCSFGYTLMNTRGFVDLAQLGRHLGVDLVAVASDTRGNIASAVDFLYRHAAAKTDWPYEQIEPLDWRMLCPILRTASALFARPYDLAPLAHRLPKDFEPDAFPMTEPLHPFGQPRSPEATTSM